MKTFSLILQGLKSKFFIFIGKKNLFNLVTKTKPFGIPRIFCIMIVNMVLRLIRFWDLL